MNDSMMSLREMVELFRDKGVYGFDVSKNGPKELAELIQSVMNHRADADASDWTWDGSARNLRALYERVLNDERVSGIVLDPSKMSQGSGGKRPSNSNRD